MGLRSVHANAKKGNVQREIDQMEKQLDGLLDRIVETDNPTVVSAYEKKIAKLEQDKLMLVDKLDQNSQSKHNLDEIFELSVLFLTNPWKIWEKGGLALKKTVLRTAFKAPLAYSKENGFRTPQTSVIFRFLGDLKEKCEMVPRRRLELPRPFGHWHLKPARLPIPPPGQVSC